METLRFREVELPAQTLSKSQILSFQSLDSFHCTDKGPVAAEVLFYQMIRYESVAEFGICFPGDVQTFLSHTFTYTAPTMKALFVYPNLLILKRPDITLPSSRKPSVTGHPQEPSLNSLSISCRVTQYLPPIMMMMMTIKVTEHLEHANHLYA